MKQNTPYYIEIFNALQHKILSGEYKNRQRFPTETELCKEYFVSRITMRRALSMLVDKGYLIRRAGSGSVVNASPKIEVRSDLTTIGLVLCDFSSSYGVELIKSIELHAEAYGYQILLKNSSYSKEREENILKQLSDDKSVKGIILTRTRRIFQSAGP